MPIVPILFPMREAINIVWFKRDLRIHDHAPLYHASMKDIPVLPLYIVEPEYWQQKFASRRHWHFIFDCLTELRSDCESLGQALIVEVGDVVDVFNKLQKKYDIKGIYAHEETGNGWTYKRDKSVISWCNIHEVLFHESPTNGVVRRLKNRDQWSKIRNKRMSQNVIPKPKKIPPPSQTTEGVIPSKDHPMFGDEVPGRTQKGGRRQAIKTLRSFLEERGQEYIYRISAPSQSERSCSRLSPHLTWGTLSIREVIKSNQARRANLSQEDMKKWRRKNRLSIH